MIKSQELVNFQGARPNGFLRVTFIYRKQANVHEYKKVRLIYDQSNCKGNFSEFGGAVRCTGKLGNGQRLREEHYKFLWRSRTKPRNGIVRQ